MAPKQQLHKRKRAAEEDGDGDAHMAATDAAPSSSGFGGAMSKIMARDLSGKATPVLAKRKTAQEKQASKAAAAHKAEVKKRKDKHKVRKAHLVVPDPLQADFERQLRKVATKGVVALFNAISKHQRAIEAATEDVSKPSAKAAVVANQNKSFLDLLKGQTTSAGGAGASSSAPAARKGPAFLQDDYVHRAAVPAPPTKGGSKAGGKAVASREREYEREEEDGWLGGGGDDDGGY